MIGSPHQYIYQATLYLYRHRRGRLTSFTKPLVLRKSHRP